MAINTHKNARIYVGVQSAQGQIATSFFNIPLDEEQDIDYDPGYDFFQVGGGGVGMTRYYTKGAKIGGKLMIPLVPGYVATGALYNWIWGRETVLDGSSPQGYWATIKKCVGTTYTETYLDCKVLSGELNVAFGGKYAGLSLDVGGLSLPSVGTGLPVTVDDHLRETTPYTFDNVAISLDPGGDGYVSDTYTDNHRLAFDNMIEEVPSLNGTILPVALANKEATRWSGSFDRYLMDTTVRAAFLQGLEGAYKMVLSSGSFDCTIELPRILHTSAKLTPGTGDIIKQNGIAFQALAGLDDTTEAGSVVEAAAS